MEEASFILIIEECFRFEFFYAFLCFRVFRFLHFLLFLVFYINMKPFY